MSRGRPSAEANDTGSKEPQMPDIEFPTPTGAAPGYLATPGGERGLATIVLQEWWGMDDSVRSICDRFAAAGFYALAPDLYRGENTTEPSVAQQKLMALSMSDAETDMCAAADHLRSLPGFEGNGVGSVGFCLGGGLSVWAAASCPNITAAVSYYYVMPHGRPDFTNINGPVLGHFGTSDDFIPTADAEALERELREAGVDTTFHYYEGAGHAFANDHDRLGTYDEALTELAWERSTDFLRSALSG
jgi:carboxymethylenebutenolidase